MPPHHRSSGDLLADRRFLYAQASFEEGDLAAAADLAAQALEIAPGFAPAWALLGRARAALGVEGAVEALERALAIEPEDALGVRLDLARLGRLDPDAAMAPGYVRALFDDYADRFDAHLVNALAYRGPELLLDAIDRLAPGRRFRRAVDLGCGTGLMGAALQGRAEALVGCDLSPAMVGKARERGVYERLEVADLLAFLSAEPPASADLAVAADVLVYLGDLRPVLAACALVLEPGGLLAFTVQHGDHPAYRLGEDARFSHGEPHIQEAAHAAGLRISLLKRASTRRDRDQDVPGLVSVLTRQA